MRSYNLFFNSHLSCAMSQGSWMSTSVFTVINKLPVAGFGRCVYVYVYIRDQKTISVELNMQNHWFDLHSSQIILPV